MTHTPPQTPDASSTLIPDDAVPRGFRFGAVRAGIKPSGKPDLACILVEEQAASAAAMFTSNRVAAAPVLLGREHLRASRSKVRAIIVNSGNANCATGEAGMTAARESCRAASAVFGCAEEQVLPCSTGVIGVPLPVEKLTAALPAVADALAPGGAAFSAFARAILTTDTKPKTAYRSIDIDGTTVRLAGACKGAGMIHPRLQPAGSPHATMLAYLITDARAEPAVLQALLPASVEATFNRISIDGDTSTNDTVLLLASGASGAVLPEGHAGFTQALDEICRELALAIVDDGEGVEHVVTLEVSEAPTDADALTVAKAIAHSPLVKTAWAGSDPNWGRLASSIGASGVAVDPAKLHITLDGLPVCKAGGRAPDFSPEEVHAAMRKRYFTIAVRLGLGAGQCRFWTTDLTAEYVRINADYSS